MRVFSMAFRRFAVKLWPLAAGTYSGMAQSVLEAKRGGFGTFGRSALGEIQDHAADKDEQKKTSYPAPYV